MGSHPATGATSHVSRPSPRPSPMIRPIKLLLVLSFALACQQNKGLRSKAPAIDASPAQVLFQPLPVGRSAAGVIEVRNVGSADLHFSADPSLTEADNDGLIEYTLPSILDRSCEGG